MDGLPEEQNAIDVPDTPDVPEVKPEVEAAKAKGWKPKEEFDGDESLWVEADEFLRRVPLHDKMRAQNRKVKDLERSMTAMANNFKTMVDATVKQQIAALELKRDEAIDLGDKAMVREIDRQISDVANSVPVADIPKVDPAIAEFAEAQKDWFNKDDEMTADAIAINEAYLKRYPGDIEGSLEHTLKKIKTIYPDKFKTQRTPPSGVEGGAKQSAAGSKFNVGRLNSEQKLAYNQFVKVHKLMSHDQYFESLEQAGFLE